jgi:DNA polymerase III epsilon subunit-like protein
VVDPLVIDRALDRYRKGKRTLTETSKHYRVPISEQDAHGATADALCAARVAWKLAGAFPDELADLEALQDKQARWHANWVDHFADYQRSLGRPALDLSRDWPIRAVPEPVPA